MGPEGAKKGVFVSFAVPKEAPGFYGLTLPSSKFLVFAFFPTFQREQNSLNTNRTAWTQRISGLKAPKRRWSQAWDSWWNLSVWVSFWPWNLTGQIWAEIDHLHNSGTSKWGLSKWGLKVLVHNCPQLPPIVVILRRKFPLERGPKWPQKCKIVDDCAQIAESRLKPP